MDLKVEIRNDFQGYFCETYSRRIWNLSYSMPTLPGPHLLREYNSDPVNPETSFLSPPCDMQFLYFFLITPYVKKLFYLLKKPHHFYIENNPE